MDLKLSALQHKQRIDQTAQFERSVIGAIEKLVTYLDGKTTKTEVVNQLKEIGTPDALKVVDAVNAIHTTLKGQKQLDLAPLTATLSNILVEVKQIPKQNTEAIEQVTVKNMPDSEKLFASLEKTIQGLKLEANPVVNVEKQDFTPLQKQLSDVVLAVKGLTFPEQKLNDLSKLESSAEKANKQLDEANKHLKKLVDKPVGGGSGGSGHSTPYQNEEGRATYVTTFNGSIPTTDTALATRIDDTTPGTVYIGKAPVDSAISAAVWQIAKLDASSGLSKTWAGSAGFTQIWDDRASLTYN